MWFKKTRDMIIETATIVRGLKGDFKEHGNDNKEDIAGLYKVIKECHESCPEKDRFDDYIKEANGTLKRIEDKYDDYHIDTKKAAKNSRLSMEKRQDDYLAKLQTIKDEVTDMKQAKKTFRQVMADMAKIAACVGVIAGVLFGIVRYTDAKKKTEDVKIEQLLNQIIKEQRVEKERREEDGG